MMPIRISVRLFISAALGCRIPTVEDVSAAKARGEVVIKSAIAAIAAFFIITKTPEVVSCTPAQNDTRGVGAELI
jgi:hypothetical protein